MLSRDDPAQFLGQVHDPGHDLVGLVQHFIVVGIDRNVGMHVAVPRVHVGRDEQTAGADLGMNGIQPVAHRLQIVAAENILQRLFHTAPVGNP